MHDFKTIFVAGLSVTCSLVSVSDLFNDYFKLLTFFFSKNTCELDDVLTRTVNILTTNKLVMLTML